MYKTIQNLPQLLCIFILFLTFTATVNAQDITGETVRITTSDGNVLIGTIEQEDDQQIVLLVEGIGRITVERLHIRKLQVIDPDRIRDGEYWFENPQGTRYFFAPNAIGLRKGSG